MFECRACLRRCIRSIVEDSPLPTTARFPPLILTPSLSIRPQRRSIATAPAVETSVSLDAPPSGIDHAASGKRSGFTLAHSEKQLKTELTYLKDPAKFADHVHYTLRQQKPEKALDLCRLASKSMNCVVAWNHIIDWMMRSKRVNEAIKIYNEMKKRGQYPDTYTYMQLLRGFPRFGADAKAEVLEQHVVKAVSIYTSMTSPTSRVKPSIMHTNATLRVCSLARDMDALWSVASKIPEEGPGAADHKTYSILLGAIRYGAFGKEGDDWDEHVPVERIAGIRQQAVNEGRRIWQEIVDKWRSGDVVIDEALVVEMANLLMFGRRLEDWDDVLNLVRQTANIERLVAPVGSPERQTGHVPSEGIVDAQTTSVEDEEGWVPTPAAHAFKAVLPHQPDPDNPKRSTRLVYVQPGNGILNVILQACMHMRIPKIASAYWDKLTNDYGVVPDRLNFKEMLRLFQFNRSSKKAVELIQQMHSKHSITAHFSTYRLAMAVLARDWKNWNVVDLALSLIDDMEQHLDHPDLETLQSILSLALQTKDYNKILTVLRREHQIVPRMKFDAECGDMISLEREMVSTIDMCIASIHVPLAELREMKRLRLTLNSHIGQAINNRPLQREHPTGRPRALLAPRVRSATPARKALRAVNRPHGAAPSQTTKTDPNRSMHIRKHHAALPKPNRYRRVSEARREMRGNEGIGTHVAEAESR